MHLWDVARVCHEENRAYCKAFGDHSQKEWHETPGPLRESVMAAVVFCKAKPQATDAEMHEAWRQRSSLRGRDPLLLELESKHRLDKVPGLKEHANMRPFAELSFNERLKYRLFRVICGALTAEQPRPGADDE